MPLQELDTYLRRATLRQLTIFEAVVRVGSYTGAAEEMHLTQPTVSMQLKKLAETIGVPLLEQVGRRIFPTEAGSALYDVCRQIIETMSNLEMKIADMQGLKRGRLRITVVTTAKYFAPHVLGRFHKLYPGVDISLKVTNRERVLQRLADNVDDVYITGHIPSEEIEVESMEVAPNPLVVLAPSDHPLAHRTGLSLAMLRNESFIMREPGSGIRDATFKLLAEQGFEPSIVMEIGSNEAIKHAVASGLGIAVMSLHTVVLEGGAAPLAVLDVEGFPIQRSWYAVYPKGKQLSAAAEAFIEFLAGEGERVEADLARVVREIMPARRPPSAGS